MWLPSASRIQRQLCQPIIYLSVRSISYKQRLYGNEEGHDKKNEVRKEKWIRKHTMRKKMGGDYREMVLQYSRNPQESGNPIIDLPDWNHPDGSVGVLSKGQQTRILEKKELIGDILESFNIVQEASKIKLPQNKS
ncbi:MRPL52 [Lepeophtheirus salmonis]|uniref:MRPL52 n=1 Tax=Lepeophtheirus salmonis TaxID=72036 RepID=A0A7R8D5B1_LEPSM|nr:MRPL52 [Lepeophtheirus salmonis]CAF3034394.1 MRPL52 [Lepeophtheirus salmonis]